MPRTHCRAAPGERVVAAVAGDHPTARLAEIHKSVSTIAAVAAGGIVAATGTELFVTFVRERPLPGLRPGQVIVSDSIQIHGSPRAEALIDAAGARVVRLPPYSPDLNPIGMAFSEAETSLKELARQTVKTRVHGIVEALKTSRPSVVLGDFGRCG